MTTTSLPPGGTTTETPHESTEHPTVQAAPEVEVLDAPTPQKASWFFCQLVFQIVPTEPIDPAGIWEHAIVSIVPVRATDREAAAREAERIGARRAGEFAEHPQDDHIDAELRFLCVRKVGVATKLRSGREVSSVCLSVPDADHIEDLVDGEVWDAIVMPW